MPQLIPIFQLTRREREDALLIVKELIDNAIIYKARLNRSGRSYYVYLPRKYNKQLERIHKERREVRVIIIPQ